MNSKPQYEEWWRENENGLLSGFLEDNQYLGPVKDWDDVTTYAFDAYCQREYQAVCR